MSVSPSGARFVVTHVASTLRPHIFGFNTARSVADDPLFEVRNGEGVTTRRFHITQEGDAVPFRDLRMANAALSGTQATLGTIGASGPATAAQNQWLRVRNNAGAVRWIPVWV